MRSEKLSQDAVHELEVVDAVVRGGGHARPEDAALTDFALLVRNARPVPDHGAAVRLDERLTMEPPVRSGARRPLFAALAATVLVLAVGGTALNGMNDSTTTTLSDDAAPETTIGSGAQLGSSTADSLERAPAQDLYEFKSQSEATQKVAVPAMSTPPNRDIARDIARDARLTLATPGDKVEGLADEVIATVDDARGYVASSEVSSTQSDRGRAEFQLMLRADTFQETFAQLSKLAHVRSRSQSTEDITAQSNSAERVLRQREERVDRLEAKLAAADTALERASAQRQLNRAKFAARQAARNVKADAARVNYVPVDLKIAADKTAATADKNTIERAFTKAGEILTAIAAVLIVFMAVAIPLALIGALVLFGRRRVQRGRADRAISEAATQPE